LSDNVVSVSRNFRDDVLAKTPRGQRYTQLYYKLSTEAVAIIMLNPMVVLRSHEVMERYLPVVQSMVKGERVIVDVERYRQRREHTVREIAMRAARQVKMTGDAITLDAMQPFERRAIHLALEGDPDVTSSSIGEEPERRVVVGPRKAAEG